MSIVLFPMTDCHFTRADVCLEGTVYGILFHNESLVHHFQAEDLGIALSLEFVDSRS
jgi:hypothetical protein